jgi:hypothetical protein
VLIGEICDRCLKDAHLAFIGKGWIQSWVAGKQAGPIKFAWLLGAGDSLTRYQYISLAYFLSKVNSSHN